MNALPFRITQPPASAAEIQELLAAVGPLPSEYLNLLAASNGAELGIHDRDGDCLALWSVRDVLELNDAYEISKWLPALLAIGSDGGDDAIGFLRKNGSDPNIWPLVRVGFGALSFDETKVIAQTFAAWKSSDYSINAEGS